MKRKDGSCHDRALVELLTDFTRVSERSVSPQFWRRNIAVMEATIELPSRTRSGLKLLAKALGRRRNMPPGAGEFRHLEKARRARSMQYPHFTFRRLMPES